MEVVGEDAIGDDLDAAEVCEWEEEIDEVLFGGVVEEELPPDSARDTVVDGAWPLDSRLSHAPDVETHPPDRQQQ